MDVGGAVFGRLEDDRVDEPDERRVGEAVVGLEVGGLFLLEELLVLLGRRAVAESLGLADCALDVVEDLLARGDPELDRMPRRQPQLVDGADIRRVGDRDQQRAVLQRVR